MQISGFIETSLKGKTALVTGASAGIGEAVAWQLAQQGVHLHLCARRKEKLESLAQKIQENFKNISIKIFCADLRMREDILSLERTNACDVDILVNNAGLARGVAKAQEAEITDWLEMIDTNISGAVMITRSVLPYLIQRGGGHIVFTGSIAGHNTYEGGSVYAATKHAIHAFARAVREETCDKKIKVTTVAPGMVDTEFSLVRLRDVNKAKDVYKGMRPLSASDVAYQMLFALKQPEHVNIDEIIVTPAVQGAIRKVFRTEI